MSSDAVEKAKKVLSNNEYLTEFTVLNQMTAEAARALLERLMRDPTASEQVDKLIFSDEASPELKGYFSGEEKGCSRGHEAGFAKGPAVGVLGTFATVDLGGVTLYLKFRSNWLTIHSSRCRFAARLNSNVGRTSISAPMGRLLSLAQEARGRIDSMMTRIERLRPGEGDRWRCIRLKALQEAPYAFGTTYAQASQWSAARWEAQVVEFATFVAVLDGRDVGVARGAAHQRSDVRELIGMWVDPTARRRGIGSQLIDSVAAWATAAGATVLVLDVIEGNAPAIALYERAGFLPFDGEALGDRAPGEARFVRSLATISE